MPVLLRSDASSEQHPAVDSVVLYHPVVIIVMTIVKTVVFVWVEFMNMFFFRRGPRPAPCDAEH